MTAPDEENRGLLCPGAWERQHIRRIWTNGQRDCQRCVFPGEEIRACNKAGHFSRSGSDGYTESESGKQDSVFDTIKRLPSQGCRIGLRGVGFTDRRFLIPGDTAMATLTKKQMEEYEHLRRNRDNGRVLIHT